MKAVLALVVLGLISTNVFADDSGLPANVLIEYSRSVGFAPPAIRGIYKFQILKSGRVQDVNNRGEVTKLAKLAPSTVESLKAKIDDLGKVTLTKPTTPPCTDAPSSGIEVRNSNGETSSIWESSGCRETETDNFKANELSKAFQNLKFSLHAIVSED